jgi:hypothetical protein
MEITLCLIADGLYNLRMRVADVRHTDARNEIEIHFAITINNPATFRLDKELEATKARIASLKQRAEGPPQR